MAIKDAKTFIQPHLLFVEGKDELGLIIPLLKVENIETVQIVELEGYTQLSRRLQLAIKTEGWANVTRLGILLDSDDMPSGRLDSIRAALKDSGLPVPQNPFEYAGDSLKVCYSTLPTPDELGCLETLIERSVEDLNVKTCVEGYLSCGGIEPGGTALRAKRWVHSYLSRSDQPGLKIGEAAKSGLLNLASPAFNSLREFLHALAAETEPAAA